MQYERGRHNQIQATIMGHDPVQPLTNSPELQLIYETAPIGLAFLSTDCRYVMINQHLTEICGLRIANHIGRTVRETVPQVAEQVENIVQAILRTGESITGIEVNGQRPDGSNKDRVWIVLAPAEKPKRANRRDQCRCQGDYRTKAHRIRSRCQPGGVA